VIAVTGIASRWAIMAGGIILIVLGMIPKLMNVIACIPGTVINGVFAIVAVFVMVNGMRVLKTVQLDERNMFIVGMPVLLGVTAAVIPAEILGSLPSLANYLFSSGTAVGAITAVLLNILIPQSKKSSEVVETQTATSAKS
jgi:NCS2 family nucleobase:cation symporter-2